MIGLTTTLGEYLETLDYGYPTRNAVRLAAAMRGIRSLTEPLSPADAASLDNLTDDDDFCEYLGNAYAGFNGKLGRELHDVLGLDSEDDGEDVARCVVCSESIDCCAGHGEDYARDVARLFRGWLARRRITSIAAVAHIWHSVIPISEHAGLLAAWLEDTQDAEPSDVDTLAEYLETEGMPR